MTKQKNHAILGVCVSYNSLNFFLIVSHWSVTGILLRPIFLTHAFISFVMFLFLPWLVMLGYCNVEDVRPFLSTDSIKSSAFCVPVNICENWAKYWVFCSSLSTQKLSSGLKLFLKVTQLSGVHHVGLRSSLFLSLNWWSSYVSLGHLKVYHRGSWGLHWLQISVSFKGAFLIFWHFKCGPLLTHISSQCHKMIQTLCPVKSCYRYDKSTQMCCMGFSPQTLTAFLMRDNGTVFKTVVKPVRFTGAQKQNSYFFVNKMYVCRYM